MVLESQSEFKSPIPLSTAKDIQRRTSRRDIEQPIAISPSSLRDMLGEVIDQKISAKISRLETSITRMLDHLDAVKQGDAEDSALRVTTDMSAVDLALASIKLYPEECHRYTTGMLAEKLGVKTHTVQKIVKKLSIKGNSDYHLKIKTGASEKSVVHKYSEQALALLRDEMNK